MPILADMRHALLSTFLCRGKFVHRYVHDNIHRTTKKSIAGATSPLVTLQSSAYRTSPLSPLLSPYSRLPSCPLSILFGLLSCCLIVPASCHVVLHRLVLSHRITAYLLVTLLHLHLSLRPLYSAGCRVVAFKSCCRVPCRFSLRVLLSAF